jgi:hypothetical protein
MTGARRLWTTCPPQYERPRAKAGAAETAEAAKIKATINNVFIFLFLSLWLFNKKSKLAAESRVAIWTRQIRFGQWFSNIPSD